MTKKGGMFPVWSPSGKELFYRHGGTIYSIGINTLQGFGFSNNRKILEGKYLTSFDVSPDGKKFIMVKDEHGTLPKQLRVVLNWTEELKQIMNSSK